MKKYLILSLVVSSFIFSCQSADSENNKVITEAVSKVEQHTYKMGEKITFTTEGLQDIDRVQVFVNENEVPNEFTIDGKAVGLGRNNVRLAFYKGTEVKHTREFTFTAFADESAATWNYEVVKTYPHNTDYFTQGFYFKNGFVFEGTGLREGKTRLLKYPLGAAEATQLHQVKDDVFGEGITDFNGKIYQLTWTDRVGYTYDQSFNQLSKFDLPAEIVEGWGITTMNDQLVITEGTHRIHFYDANMKYIRTIQAVDKTQAYSALNEIEFHDGLIYANVYQQNNIIAIDPATGAVVGKVDLSAFKAEQPAESDVLNGIAFKDGNMLVTGKLWNKIYEIKLKK